VARVRKAVVAAVGAAVAAAGTGFWQAAADGLTDTEITGVIGAAVAAAVAAGWATWKVKNAPAGGTRPQPVTYGDMP
jgi:hypothetical protein